MPEKNGRWVREQEPPRGAAAFIGGDTWHSDEDAERAALIRNVGLDEASRILRERRKQQEGQSDE